MISFQSNPQSLYDRIGGEAPVRQLTQAFYSAMDTLPEAEKIRAMHQDMARAEEHLFMFLSGWMGGPQLFVEKFGHPRLRMRHMPFVIDQSARDQWMHCMKQALDQTVNDEKLRCELLFAFAEIADFMRNQEPSAKG
ncbi:MAG: group II truncated hemoglobin [Zetaproteobacteria bacterium]|nr:group II truncated hemoglobin [Zetaproteobacteria bacterium]